MAVLRNSSRNVPTALVLKRIGAVAFWLVLWQLAALMIDNELLLVGPVGTAVTLARLVVTARFWSIVAGSFCRIVIGFLLAFCLGLVCAVAARRLSAVRTLLQPFMAFIKSTPVVCVIVLLLIWFGSRIVPTVAVCLVVLPAIYFSSLGALDHLDPKVRQMLQLHQVPFGRQLAAFIWPSMLPYLTSTCQLVVGMSWKSGVAAELIGIPLGSIGERIYQTKLLLDTGALFSWTIVIICLAFVCEKLFLWLLRRSGTWAQRRGAACAAHPRTIPAALTTPEGFSAENLTVGYGEVTVLGPMSARLEAGTRNSFSDPSGSGKTTLLHALAGLMPVGGALTRPSRISMVFQESRLIDELSARDNVAVAAGHWMTADQVDALLTELLPQVDPATRVSELSGGQRRRVELARALACPSQAVLLDEPFASLDRASREAAAACVRRHLSGRTLVLATHGEGDADLLDARRVTLPKAEGLG